MPELKDTQPMLKPENVLRLSWQNSVLGRADMIRNLGTRGSGWYLQSRGQMPRVWILRHITGREESISHMKGFLLEKGELEAHVFSVQFYPHQTSDFLFWLSRGNEPLYWASY